MVKVGKKKERLDNAVKDTTFSTHHRSSQYTSAPRFPVVPQYIPVVTVARGADRRIEHRTLHATPNSNLASTSVVERPVFPMSHDMNEVS